MKKFFFSIATIFLLMTASVANAGWNQYEDDINYQQVDGGRGGAMYLNLRSVNVQEHNPPHFQIAGDFVFVGGHVSNWGIIRRYHIIVRYNYNTREAYFVVGNSEINNSRCGTAMKNSLFRIAYGRNFFPGEPEQNN